MTILSDLKAEILTTIDATPQGRQPSPELIKMLGWIQMAIGIASGDGGSGGASAAEIEAATKAAIDSSTYLDLLTSLVSELPTSRLTQTEVQLAIQAATNLDGIEGSLSSILSGLITQAQVKTAIESATTLNDIETLLAAATPAGENYLGRVGGDLQDSIAALTRAATTPTYGAKTAIVDTTGNPIQFANAGRLNAGSGYITGARCHTNQPAFTAQVRLHLFTQITFTPPVDTASFAYNSGTGVFSSFLALIPGWIDFYFENGNASGSTDSISCGSFAEGRQIPYKCAAGDNKLYGLLEAVGGFTAGSGQWFRFELMFDRN